MNRKNMKFSVSAHFDGDIQKIWDLAMDTELQNRAAGFSAMRVRETPLKQGGSHRIGTGSMGGFRSEWVENPFEWSYPYQSSVAREYSKGPLRTFLYQARLSPADHGYRIDQDVVVVARNPFFALVVWLSFRFSLLKSFARFFEGIAKQLTEKTHKPLRFGGLGSGNQTMASLVSLQGKLSPCGSPSLVEALSQWIVQAMPADLSRIRPYRVAKALGLNKRETVIFFLRATKAGFFNLRWDILCPECRGPKDGAPSLSGINRTVHCPSCNVDFDADFDRSVELTFSPAPSVRTISDDIFCLGSPLKTAHIRCQQRLAPGNKRSVQILLEAGVYRVHSPQCKGSGALRIVDGGPQISTIGATFAAEGIALSTADSSGERNREITCAPGSITLNLASTAAYEVVARLERAEWLEDIVSAAEVSAMQEFRDSFSSEVLRPGQEIAVKNLCFMFTDLKGSTSFYNMAGDAPAFGAVRDHFALLGDSVREHNGAIVKTIGDAIMAVFTTSLDAVQCAVDMQKAISRFNERPNGLVLNLKIGLHAGPALAVNLNDRLDYFGRTVNLAARTEGTCKGGDVVFTPGLLQAAGVVAWLKSSGVRLSKFNSSLKGFDQVSELVRLVPNVTNSALSAAAGPGTRQ